MASSILQVDYTDAMTAILTLNRPAKRNALSIELMEALCDALDSMASEPERRVAIVRGAGPVFCAGLDLDEAADSAKSETSALWVAKTFQTVLASPIVTIAAAHGAAIAGGAGLMCACDFVVAADDLRIGFPEVRRGLVPALISAVIGDQVGRAVLRELLLLAEPIDAGRAAILGLVHRVIAAAKVMDEAHHLADTILRAGPQATRKTKQLLCETRASTVLELLEHALQVHKEARNSAEAREGIMAFLERREPEW